MSTQTSTEPAKSTSTGLAELVVPAILLALAVFLLIGTMNMQVPASVQTPGPTFFPMIVIGVLVLMALLSTVSILRNRKATATVESAVGPAAAAAGDVVGVDEMGNPVDAEGNTVNEVAADPPPGREPWPPKAVSDWRATLTVLGSFVVFTIALRPLGWILAAAALFWGVSWALGSRRPAFDISVALVLSSAIQLIFGSLLGIPLPAGFLEGAL